VIVNTDILSIFAKIDAINLLNLLFGGKIAMTSRIRDEILVPLTYGYAFPRNVSTVETVSLTNKALEEYLRFQENVTLGRGELEAIAYCKAEKCIFVTNDTKARKFAEAEGVSVVSFQALLKALWKKKLKTKKEVREILNNIIETDNLAVSREVEKVIFE